MKKRTRARELALQFLYMLDLRGPDFVEEMRDFYLGRNRPPIRRRHYSVSHLTLALFF